MLLIRVCEARSSYLSCAVIFLTRVRAAKEPGFRTVRVQKEYRVSGIALTEVNAIPV